MNSQNIKNINKKNSTFCVQHVRKQEIIFVFLAWQKPRNWIHENELSFYFREQNKTEYSRISILLLSRVTFNKTTENKGKRLVKTNLKRRNLIIFSPCTEVIQWHKRKMKVVHQKDDENKPIILRLTVFQLSKFSAHLVLSSGVLLNLNKMYLREANTLNNQTMRVAVN